MSMDPAKVREEALRLPVEARARLAAELLRSLDDAEDQDSTDYDSSWGAELGERMRQIDRGEVETVPWHEARRRIIRED
jgi:putative addiction module component (TIGR02574 family)